MRNFLFALSMGISLTLQSAVAGYQQFSEAIGDNALRLAIEHFSPNHQRPITYFSREQLHFVAFLSQLPKEIDIASYPLYNSEDRYKILYAETSKQKIYKEWKKSVKNFFGKCAREIETVNNSNNSSNRVTHFYSKTITYFPLSPFQPGSCSSKISRIFQDYQLASFALQISHTKNGKWKSSLSIKSSEKQDLNYVVSELRKIPMLKELTTKLMPKPLSRQVDYYENQIHLNNNRTPQRFEDPIVLELTKFSHINGQVTSTITTVVGVPVYNDQGKPTFEYVISRKQSID